MTTELSENLRVMVVDDDPFVLRQANRILKKQGIQSVTVTDSAEDALKMLASHYEPTDIVICDLNMPGLDGVELIRHISRVEMKVSLILISGEDARILQTAVNIAQERNINVLGAIQKPLTADNLRPLLNSPSIARFVNARTTHVPSLAQDLSDVIQQQALEVYYQPQVDIDTGRTAGVEALARWKHPEKGHIPPPVFIGLAEQMNLIGPLTTAIYNKAFRDMGQLRQEGFPLNISVNFSSRGLEDLSLPEKVMELLSKYQLPPDQVTVEVTESALAHDMVTCMEILTRFRLKGLGLSIDDFGTGFSTMEQLQRIPFTELKVDRAFVHGAVDNPVSLAILESSLTLAKRLNIHTVAEGVEDQRDLELVKGYGCELVQGYLYAKPMPFEALSDWLKQHPS